MNKNSDKKIKRIKLRILLIALTGTVALGSIAFYIASLFGKKTKEYDIKSIITQEADNTYFDDFIGEELEKQLIDLEEYIKLSNELNKIIGKEYTIEDESLKDSILKSPEEIKELVNKYDKAKKDVDVLRELKVQASLVNKYLKTDGYEIIADALIYVFKIELVDAYGFDKDISKEILKQIVIPGYNDMHFGDENNRKDYIKIGRNNITFSRKLENVLEKIYKLQDNDGKENTKGYDYNKDRIKLLEESFGMLKDVIQEESEFNKIKVK